ncbi:MAG: type I methionyl aminopeptidase [Deltaproteobacteria bacterium]|nr:type I methionyl aminopeptidase [Deltaproteobacteria bacterium]
MINLKNQEEIEYIRASGRLAALTLDYIATLLQPGQTTEKIDRLGHDFIIDHGAIPSTLGYRGYPKSMCISINEEVVHGIPGSRRLKDGDLVKVDVTVYKDGFHGDTARTFALGDASKKARQLMETTYQAMLLSIETVKIGAHLGDIGATIQEHVENAGFSVVRTFVGHGIGREFHEEPQVPHYGRRGSGIRLKEGMVFTIEPMINEGGWEVRILQDGWTAVTKDGKLSAQFEHTIAVTSNGADILTLS